MGMGTGEGDGCEFEELGMVERWRRWCESGQDAGRMEEADVDVGMGS